MEGYSDPQAGYAGPGPQEFSGVKTVQHHDMTAIVNVIDQLFKELEVNSESLNRLQNRIETVLRPGNEMAEPKNAMAAGSPEVSTLQNKLWSAVGMLGDTTRRINSTIERVDL
jgi:uncharacterized protein YukE